jgi:hypothetical protein
MTTVVDIPHTPRIGETGTKLVGTKMDVEFHEGNDDESI